MRKILVAALAAFGLLVLGTVSAQAEHSGNRNTENLEHVTFSHASECGSASVTVTVPEGTPPTWQYGAAVTVDGVAAGSVFQVGPGVNTLDLVFDEDQGGGDVVVEYSLEHATESDLLDGTEAGSFEVITDCEPPEDGTDGSDGSDGQDGTDGTDGAPGDDGADGKDGADGADGKDGEVKTVTKTIQTPTRINTGR